jgi:hypothetical protein
MSSAGSSSWRTTPPRPLVAAWSHTAANRADSGFRNSLLNVNRSVGQWSTLVHCSPTLISMILRSAWRESECERRRGRVARIGGVGACWVSLQVVGPVRRRRRDAGLQIVTRFKAMERHDNCGIMLAREPPFSQVGAPLKLSQLLISGFRVRVPGGALPHTPLPRFLRGTGQRHPDSRPVVYPSCVHRSATGLPAPASSSADQRRSSPDTGPLAGLVIIDVERTCGAAARPPLRRVVRPPLAQAREAHHQQRQAGQQCHHRQELQRVQQ